MQKWLREWWPVPAGAIGFALSMFILGATNDKMSSEEWLKGVILGFFGSGGIGLYFQRRWQRKAEGAFRFTVPPGGLPAAEWEERQMGGGVGGVSVLVRRRLYVERDADGQLQFVIDTSRDDSYKVAPLVGAGRDILRAQGYLQKRDVVRWPWAMLESFSVTDNASQFGASGKRPERSFALIIADFGSIGGQVVVSDSDEPGYEIASRRSVLTVLFIEKRGEILARLKSQERAVAHGLQLRARGRSHHAQGRGRVSSEAAPLAAALREARQAAGNPLPPPV